MRYFRALCIVLLFSVCGGLSVVARDFYWEEPVALSSSESRFPSSATNGIASAIIWQEIRPTNNSSGSIWLSGRFYTGSRWIERQRFAGPYEYAGEIPSIASVSIDDVNSIFVSVVNSPSSVALLISDDWGENFSTVTLESTQGQILDPRLFSMSNDSYMLFATRGGDESFDLVYSRSSDGKIWTPFVIFEPSRGKKRAFLPVHSIAGSSDIVIFQAFHEGSNRSSYQLYSSISQNGGALWSEARILTSFIEPLSQPNTASATFENYHNQRAKLARFGDGLALVWERARNTTEKYGIYFAQLSFDGLLKGTPERISSEAGFCYDPEIALLDGEVAVLWFDNRLGSNRIYLARKEGFLWSETDLSRVSRDAVFGRIVNVGGKLEVFWQQTLSNGNQRILTLVPDGSVRKPRLTPLNFVAARKSRVELVRIGVQMPEDSSGIAGYSWAWGFETFPDVPKTIQSLPTETSVTLEATKDGTWTLGVRVLDYAGNWSEPGYLSYTKDTTPPLKPRIIPARLDDSGFLESNTFEIFWEPSEVDDIAGYSWNFEYLASTNYLDVLKTSSLPASFDLQSAAASRLSPKRLPSSIRTKEQSARFTNVDNGLYAVSVSAIDETGNVSEPAISYFMLNKYVPFTTVAYIDPVVDQSGLVRLSIVGRGFTEGGLIREIILDRDGVAPWDLILERTNNEFRIANDRLITGIVLSDMEEGMYRIILDHPSRGAYTTRPLLSITSFGTVKFGDYTPTFTPPWHKAVPTPQRWKRPDGVFLYAIIAFAVVLLFFSGFGIASVATDSLKIHTEVRALLTGEIMPSIKKRKTVALKQRGLGLRFKLVFFTTTLVISVVLLVSLPLGLRFSANQEQTLAQGLEARVLVLLESLSSGARAYLPSQNVLELGFLPSQMSALDEAISATITGNGMGNEATGINFVWATNDVDIAYKIDTSQFLVGRSRFESIENTEIDARVLVLEKEARESVRDLSLGITELTQEGIKLALRTDTESVQRRDEIQTITRQLEEKLAKELQRLSLAGTGSYPEYNPLELSRDIKQYVFYKPVLYRQGGSDQYVHGTVRIAVSTESLIAQVIEDRRSLVQTTVYIAFFAVLMGMIGALLLASIIISPIRKLAAHVAMIRDTEDKEELSGKDIRLKTRDEIALLGDTINDMAHGLVKAAAAYKDLSVGKEIQKMFIPLDTDENGRKLTCGSTVDENVEFFGYYEGAKGVSGDYFDYIKLDERHYAIIKCDVAGKGVPAALIMVEVATLFLDYFKDWTFAKNGYRLNYIVSRINDLIESRAFKGRFAAFTLCIFDSKSGDVHFCNAGDNLVHIYDSHQKKMKKIVLPESSAAGVFPTFLVDMKGGFQVVKQHLNSGDVLFLYTDGVEEAKRMFRTPKMQPYICAEPGLEANAPHGSHSVGQESEEMGPERVNEIIEAVLERKVYTLYKWHNHEGEKSYEFDFTNIEGSLEEVTLALVAVEKIFRMYQDPRATEFDRVQVDRKVDLFLNKHFKQYADYCSYRKDHPVYPEYQYYTSIKEDDQYDDLTLLMLRKK